jgi:hypothetical protein
MSIIITRNSATSGSIPASLVQGELAINVTDGKLFYGSGSGNIVKEFTGSASGGTINTGSLLTTASFSNPNLTFTKGDGNTFNVNLVSLVPTSASFASTASFAPNYVLNSATSSFVQNSQTSSFVLNSQTSSMSVASASFITASGVYGPYGSNSVISASYALNGGVTQLLAGPNVTLSPTNGLGQVTVSATLSGSTIFNTATGSYGSFYDTTIQTNPVANIARSMSFNSTDITNGVSISGSTSPFNTYIKTTNAGVYDIQFSAQVEKTDSGTDVIVIWLRKNGIDLTDSATKLTLSGNSTKVVAAWNWFVSSAANDYYQIIWVSADTGMRLYAEPINDTPGIPSVIATVNRVDQFLSNTGSFSGSFTGVFTGSLQGTASFATSASFASTASISLNSWNLTGNAGTDTGSNFIGTTDNQDVVFRRNNVIFFRNRIATNRSNRTELFLPSGIDLTFARSDGFLLGINSNSTVGYGDNTLSLWGVNGMNFSVFNGDFTWYNSNNFTAPRMTLKNTTGNLLLNTTTDAGFRLDVSGSTRIQGDTTITGSLTVVTGSAVELQVTNTGVTIGNAITDTHRVTGSLNISGSTNINGDVQLTGSMSSTGSRFTFRTTGTTDVLSITGSTGAYGNSVVTIDALGQANQNGLRISNIGAGDGGLELTRAGGAGSLIINKFDLTPTIYAINKNLRFWTNNNAFDSSGISFLFTDSSKTSTHQKGFLIQGSTNTFKSGSYFEVQKSGSIPILHLAGDAQSGSFSPNELYISGSLRVNSGNSVITGSLTVVSDNARELQVTATGVNIGNIITDTHTVTGSLNISGSTNINGNARITGSLAVTQNITGSRMFLSSSNGTASGSTLTIYGSGSAQPVFTVQGSQGELFSITDSLSGSLFSVNDISGLPILEVFSDNTTLMGSYLDPMLITTTKLVTTSSGAFILYSLPTSSYDTAFFEYSIKSGSNARAGSIIAIQSGTSVNFTETTTTDFGSTSGFGFIVQIAGTNMILTGSATTSGWTIKTIVRGI